MTDIEIEVTVKVKIGDMEVELSKEDAKKLRDALDKQLKAEPLLPEPEPFDWNKISNPAPSKPDPFYPFRQIPDPWHQPRIPQLGQPYWEVRPFEQPTYEPMLNPLKITC